MISSYHMHQRVNGQRLPLSVSSALTLNALVERGSFPRHLLILSSKSQPCSHGKVRFYSCPFLAITHNFHEGESQPFIRNVFTLNPCSHIVGSQVISTDN